MDYTTEKGERLKLPRRWREGYRANENSVGRDCWVNRLTLGRGASVMATQITFMPTEPTTARLGGPRCPSLLTV